MRCLYLSLIDITQEDGYDRKALGQLKAFTSFGWDSYIICHRGKSITEGIFRGRQILWLNQTSDYSNILIRRIRLFLHALKNVAHLSPELIYVRYPRADLIFTLFLLFLLMRKECPKIISEIPTYPFRNELPKLNSLRGIMITFGEILFRPVVTWIISAYSIVAYEGSAFGKDSIRIENGVDEIDFDDMNCSKPTNVIEMIFVTNFSENNLRHGIDRVLEGLKNYQMAGNTRMVRLNIVGEVSHQNRIFRPYFKELVAGTLIFHGQKNFIELRDLYKKMHVGIGCLGFHRIGVNHTSALKEREYLSFGIPIVTSSLDFSFDDNFPYRLKFPSDDSSVDINRLILFVDFCYKKAASRSQIRQKALEAAAWNASMVEVKKFMEQ